jgi:copper chaperone CopZ
VPRHLLIALLAMVLAVPGCGAQTDSAGDFDGAEQDVARAIEDLEEAGQEDEPRRICDALLAKELVERIKASGTDCVKAVDKALDEADSFTLTVEDVEVKGAKATARVETGVDEEKVETLELVREGKDWKISGLPGSGSG